MILDTLLMMIYVVVDPLTGLSLIFSYLESASFQDLPRQPDGNISPAALHLFGATHTIALDGTSMVSLSCTRSCRSLLLGSRLCEKVQRYITRNEDSA